MPNSKKRGNVVHFADSWDTHTTCLLEITPKMKLTQSYYGVTCKQCLRYRG